MAQNSSVDQRWQKAAVLGSVWASVEIVLGSFLHNIRFPLSGTILSAIGISILVAGDSLWKEKGVVWRAGIICAVMKSVSPSSVIFGPMIGITVEAFIVELAIRMIGGNTVGYIVGGAIACTTPVIQKTVSYIFTFGMNVTVLFEKIVEFTSKTLQVQSLKSSDIVIAVIGINLLIGGVAAIVGLVVGRRSKKLLEGMTEHSEVQKIRSSNLSIIPDEQFSIALLLLHGIVLVSGLIVQSYLFLFYIAVCFYRYPHIKKRFQRFGLWVEIGVVSILAGIIIGNFTLSDWYTGLLIGIRMLLRAVFVVSLFSAISVEFRNPAIVHFLFRHRLKKLSAALDSAFESLPSIIDSLQKEKSFFKHPIDSLSRILSYAAAVTYIKSQGAKIFILTGEKQSGKTTLLQTLITELMKNGKTVDGILQIGISKKGARYGFDLYDIHSRNSIPLCRTDAPDDGIVAGPFKFYKNAIQFGEEILSILKISRSDIVIIDEAGPLELSGGGWAHPLSVIIENYSGILILVVRTSLIEEICRRFVVSPISIWDIEKISVSEITRSLLTVSKNQS